MSEENYDRWHPLYYTTQGFPDEVDSAFATILAHLQEVQSMCNVKVTGPLHKVLMPSMLYLACKRTKSVNGARRSIGKNASLVRRLALIGSRASRSGNW